MNRTLTIKWWEGLIFALGLTCLGVLLGMPDDSGKAKVGGDWVPTDMRCEEDEVIGVTPEGISCIHLDDLAE